ncbi:sensor histidine kinase [Nocardioides sp. GXZ039]|uniref:sensor histidine kinase n=1 Tax=Nocardioides sp. GXZ039 TaxID=3136018 RepID=UPI0030F388FF
MTDSVTMGGLDLLAPLGPTRPNAPLTRETAFERLRLTLLGVGLGLLGIPVALVLAIGSVLAVPLALTVVGLVVALAVVPATAALAGLHRRIAGTLLREEVVAGYAPDTRRLWARPFRWVRDPARWRDVGFLWYSATGGFVLSMLPLALLTAPLTHLVAAILDGGAVWWLLVLLDGPLLLVWWLVTPTLVRARVTADATILGHGARARVERLERRVAEVTSSRSESLDHNAAEVRRIERDLHDGAQARMTAVGMNVGLAEKLIATDPDAAAAMLREVRETTLAALADLRAVVRGIHPPMLADLGLAGGIEALAGAVPLPVTVSVHLPGGDPPAPLESAVYFAVAEALTNVVKHASATRAWVTVRHDGERLHALVGDDGRGGAAVASGPDSTGLAGLERRLAAFDGTMTVSSPVGGPTVVTWEVPCASSSLRTRPSSGSD